MISKNEILNSGIFDFTVFPVEEDAEIEEAGKNKKKILIAIDGGKDPERIGFLEKVMGAVDVDIHTDARVVFLTHGQQFSLARLASSIAVEKAIFFGIEPSRAGMNINQVLYQPFSFGDKTVLMADALAAIQQDARLKRPLWEGLKSLFQ